MRNSALRLLVLLFLLSSLRGQTPPADLSGRYVKEEGLRTLYLWGAPPYYRSVVLVTPALRAQMQSERVDDAKSPLRLVAFGAKVSDFWFILGPSWVAEGLQHRAFWTKIDIKSRKIDPGGVPEKTRKMD